MTRTLPRGGWYGTDSEVDNLIRDTAASLWVTRQECPATGLSASTWASSGQAGVNLPVGGTARRTGYGSRTEMDLVNEGFAKARNFIPF